MKNVKHNIMLFILCNRQKNSCIIFSVIKMKLSHKQKYRLLGLNIAYYRKLNGYTQETLAEKLDIDRTTVSKIELANAGVSLDVVFDIADLFGIPVEKLFVFR